VQGPVAAAILHDQKCRLVVGHMIVAVVTGAETPASSCSNSWKSQPYRTDTLGNCSPTAFYSGSSAYYDVSWYGSSGAVPSFTWATRSRSSSTEE
jgi:hypothetical protein